MEITNIKIKHLWQDLAPPFNAAWDPTPRTAFGVDVVIVETDEGITGVGGGDSMAGFEDFNHLFVGEDPFGISRHSRVLETIAFHAKRYWPLEAALWDIIGKACGQPVARLFGGSESRLPVYASCGELKPPTERAESALALREEGFRAMKIRVDPNQLEEGLAAVAATREAIGDSMEIMVDLNEAWRMAGDTSRSIDSYNVAQADRRHPDGVGCVLAGGATAVLGPERYEKSPGMYRRACGRGRDGPQLGGGARVCRGGRVGRLPAGRGAHARDAPGAFYRGACDGPQPLVHATHLDGWNRAAGEPARNGGGRWRTISGIPLRPSRLDAGASGLYAGGAFENRRRRLPKSVPDAPGLGAVLDPDLIMEG